MPYPYTRTGSQHDGAIVPAPSRCVECRVRECESPSELTGVQLCRFGYNFVRLDDGTVLNGIVAPDSAGQSRQWQKNLRRDRTRHVRRDALLRIMDAAHGAVTASDEELAHAKEEALNNYRSSEEFQRDSIELLKPEIQQSLSQVHDYRSLVGQIVQNVNVLLDARKEGELEAKLDASPREATGRDSTGRRALWRVNSLPLYSSCTPREIRDPLRTQRIRLHGLVTKYEKIYEGAFEDRAVNVRFEGESWGELRANPDAVGVIPHTFIDNALKYAPPSTEVVIRFEENEHTILLEVASWGPKIAEDELPLLFDLYFRGEGARKAVGEGTGFGLALAMSVANEIGVTLAVHQESQPGPADSRHQPLRALFHKD